MPRRDPGRPVTLPFTVLVDQQEGLPYTFEGLRADAARGRVPLVVPIRTQHLRTGDYSIAGMQERVSVERKSLTDLYRTLGQARDRFVRELERLAVMDCASVVVEASWHDVLFNSPRHSRLVPKTVHRSVIAWQQRYPRIHWWMCGDRRVAEVTTLRILERFWHAES